MERHGIPQEITPVLKDWDCTYHDPIESWQPETDVVDYHLALHIGPPDLEAADLWYVQVFTPAGLARAKQEGQRIGPKPPIIVRPYRWSAVLDEAQRRVASCTGFGWLDVQEKLRRQFHWEWEGMAQMSEKTLL